MALTPRLSAPIAERVVPWHAATRRRASDAVRLLVGFACLAAMAPLDAPSLFEPTGPVAGFARGLMAVAGTGLVVVVANWAIRSGTPGRFVRDVVFAAVLAVALTWLTLDRLGSPAPAWVLGLGAALAVVSAGRPYGTAASRRVSSMLTVTITGAAVAVGPTTESVVTVVLAAWIAGAVLHLLLGSPRAQHTLEVVERDAAAIGFEVRDLQYAERQRWGVTNLIGSDSSGRPLTILAFGRDAADAQFLSRGWRLLWYRDSTVVMTSSRLQQAEHAALTLLLAERADVRVPSLVGAGQAPGADDALVILRPQPGRPLSDLAASEISDGVLDDIWANLRRQHRGGLSHGNVVASAIVVDADGRTSFDDLGSATLITKGSEQSIDAAQLVAALACLIGTDRAAGSALRALGADGVASVLPLLQPSAMPPAQRRIIDKSEVLEPLRSLLAELADVPTADLAKLHRFAVSDALMLAFSLFGINLIVRQIGSVDGLGQALADASFGWILVALLLGATTSVAYALSFTGATSTPLPFRPVILLQMANLFTGLVGGTVALAATNIRFAQRRGLAPAVAVSVGILMSFAGFVIQVVTLVLALWSYSPEFDFSQVGGSLPGWIVPVGILAAVLVALAFGIPRFRSLVLDRVRPSAHAVRDDLLTLFRSPRQLLRLVSGAALAQILAAGALWASLQAFDVDRPLVLLLAISTVAALAGGLAPVPGGLGVIEATLIAGLTATGVDQTSASASVLSYRMVTAYLPPVWGWASMMWLRHNAYL